MAHRVLCCGASRRAAGRGARPERIPGHGSRPGRQTGPAVALGPPSCAGPAQVICPEALRTAKTSAVGQMVCRAHPPRPTCSGPRQPTKTADLRQRLLTTSMRLVHTQEVTALPGSSVAARSRRRVPCQPLAGRHVAEHHQESSGAKQRPHQGERHRQLITELCHFGAKLRNIRFKGRT